MILGIDQGTTGSTAVLLSDKGRLVGKATAAVPQHFPRAAWVEHDPKQIWTSVEKAVRGVLRQTKTNPKKIKVIGLTNQRETVSLFDGGRPLHKFIVWQDRRTAPECEKLKKYEKQIQSRSGLPIDPYFSATKIKWLINKLGAKARKKSVRFRTIDSFLFYQLTGADVIEATNASRTQLLNLKTMGWDKSLFDYHGIPKHLAPTVIPSEGFNLKTKGVGFLPDGIPVQACMGDQQAALFGQNGWVPGSGKITMGTGAFILLNTGSKPIISKNNLCSTVGIQWANGKALYALEGSAFICGAWIQWLRDQLKILPHSEASEKLALKVKSSEGVMVIPALSGMGAPFWKPELRGAILGLTRGSNNSHLARASLEAISFQNKALVSAMKKDSPSKKTEWRVDGGAVANNLLLQIQSDVLKLPITRPKNLEATGTGAALLAAYSEGLFSLNDISSLWKKDKIFKPSKASKNYAKQYADWINAIERLS
jgi:glycerol kinase